MAKGDKNGALPKRTWFHIILWILLGLLVFSVVLGTIFVFFGDVLVCSGAGCNI